MVGSCLKSLLRLIDHSEGDSHLQSILKEQNIGAWWDRTCL